MQGKNTEDIIDKQAVYCPSRRLRDKKNPLPRRLTIQATVTHWTGKKVWLRSKQWKKPINEVIQLLYQKKLRKQPHYAICPNGTILQFIPENKSAVHISTRRQRLYDRKWWRWIYDRRAENRSRKGRGDYAYVGNARGKAIHNEWFCRWPNIMSPNKILSGPIVNGNSIGIELVAWQKKSLWMGNFTQKQYDSLHGLLRRIWSRHRFLDNSKNRNVTHSDVSPVTRTTRSGRPWDPPRLDWQKIL